MQDALKCCQNICYCVNSSCSGQNPISQEYNCWQSTCPWERKPCEKYVMSVVLWCTTVQPFFKYVAFLELFNSERSLLLSQWLRLVCCGYETLKSVWFEMCEPLVLLTWQRCMYFNLDMSCGSDFCSDMWLRPWGWGRCRLPSCRTAATATSGLTCILEITQVILNI